MSPEPRAPASRCAVHPGRLAVDRCRRCGRLRCAPDAQAYADRGCRGCLRRGDRRRVRRFEATVRAGLAGIFVALIGGAITTQYVDDHLFSLIVPGLIGAAASWAGSAAIGRHSRNLPIVAVVASLAGLVGTALGFRLVPGGQSPLHPDWEVGPPYLCTVIGAVVWTLIWNPRPRSPVDRSAT